MRAQIVTDQAGRFYGIRVACPGGCIAHTLPVSWIPEGMQESEHIGQKPRWTFNGDLERPTLGPSILSRSSSQGGDICHSFVVDGRIQYLGDCTHALAGQTVDLPEIGGEASEPSVQSKIGIDLYVVYDRPRDYPESVVVRRWRGLDPEWGVRLFASIDEARALLARAELTPIGRMPGDDPAIREVWL